MDVNIKGNMNILEGVRRLGLKPRIVLAGSSCEYGRSADEWDGPHETAPLNPVTPYAVSKLGMEKLGNQYYMSFGIEVITVRFSLQVGVGATDTLAIHEFCKQVAMAEAGVAEPIIYHGNLRTTREITDCRDSAPVVVAVGEKGVPGEAYNIGSNMVAFRHGAHPHSA
jgi:nucleoside-diphosphate-sugar epimerase